MNVSTRALSLVIIAGLAAGALGGTMLVNHQTANVNEPTVLVEPNNAPSDELEAAIEFDRAQGGVMSATANESKPQRRYRARRLSTRPRAYRIAIIR